MRYVGSLLRAPPDNIKLTKKIDVMIDLGLQEYISFQNPYLMGVGCAMWAINSLYQKYTRRHTW